MHFEGEDVVYLIGVDVGSTNWKVIAYDHAGRVVARFRCPSKTHFEGEGAYYLPDEMWETLAGGIQRVVAELPEPALVDGIAVTSVGEAGVLLDAADRPVCPTLAWFDPRTAPQAKRWRAKFEDPYELYELTGFAPQHIASVNKLMWVREEDPEAYSRAQTWLCVADFVAQRLSGEKAMDYSLASRTGLFDIDRREWSARLLEAAGIDRSLMPRLAPSGSPVGLVDRMASQLTGLPIGTPVFTGGHDHICGALAVGVTDEGAVLDSTGTAEAVLMVLKGPNTSRALCEAGFSVGCHTARDRYYLLGSLYLRGGYRMVEGPP
jgi:xylulokinase